MLFIDSYYFNDLSTIFLMLRKHISIFNNKDVKGPILGGEKRHLSENVKMSGRVRIESYVPNCHFYACLFFHQELSLKNMPIMVRVMKILSLFFFLQDFCHPFLNIRSFMKLQLFKIPY